MGRDSGDDVPTRMLLQFPPYVDLPYWQLWLPMSVGLLVGIVVMRMGHRMAERRRMMDPPVVQKMHLPDPFSQGSILEQRRSVRRAGHAVSVVVYDAKTQQEMFPSWVLDRSMGGLGLAAPRQIPPGTVLYVRAANAPLSSQTVEVEVRRCQKLKAGEWALGCQYTKSYPVSTLLLFG